MREVLCLILGGGRGKRLLPLTKLRSKPAVPIAGKYRLIDIPISNCLNSGFNRMYVLQYINSLSCTNPPLCGSNGVVTNDWVNFKTFFAAPFTNHFIVHDTRTNKGRFYRLKVTP